MEMKPDPNRWSRISDGQNIVDTILAVSKKIEASTRRCRINSCVLVKPNPVIEKILNEYGIKYQYITKK